MNGPLGDTSRGVTEVAPKYRGPCIGGPNEGEVLGSDIRAIRVAKYPEWLTHVPRGVRLGMYVWDDARTAWWFRGYDDGKP